MKNTSKQFALGTVFAAAAGYVAGLLTAPQSGKKTRQDIKYTTVRGAQEAERQLKRLHTELNDVIGEAGEKAGKLTGRAKQDLEVAVQATRVAKEKAREILSAVHDGKAEDKELENAVKEARQAVDHLKSFLKRRSAP